jgi:hypothetical protein
MHIMIAQDQPFTSLQAVENLFGTGFVMAGKIAKMPYDIVRLYNHVPAVDKVLIHLIRRLERTKAEHQLVAKMRIGREKLLGKRHPEGPSKHNKSQATGVRTDGRCSSIIDLWCRPSLHCSS